MTDTGMKRTRTLYRFELSFDEEPQDVGLFNGIYDAVPDPDLADALQDRFTALPLPHVTRECTFWFTEAGLAASIGPLLDVMRVIGEYGWALSMAVIDRLDADPVYEDPYQIAYGPQDVRPQRPEYREVTPDGLTALVKSMTGKDESMTKENGNAPYEPTPCQRGWIKSFGLDPDAVLVVRWTAMEAVLQDKTTGERHEFQIYE